MASDEIEKQVKVDHEQSQAQAVDNRVHVKLVMQECSSGRYVTFEEFIGPDEPLRDWFERTKVAVDHLFAPREWDQRVVVSLGSGGIGSNKIAVIKVIREIGHLSLKEAKDVSEGLFGKDLVMCDNSRTARDVVDRLRAVGADALARSGSPMFTSVAGMQFPFIRSASY